MLSFRNLDALIGSFWGLSPSSFLFDFLLLNFKLHDTTMHAVINNEEGSRVIEFPTVVRG